MTQDRTLQTSRILPFTPDVIYGAFANADLLARWWGPEGFANTFTEFDFTEGGRWVFVMHGPNGTDYPNESIFESLEPGAKVVIRHACAPFFTLTVELTPVEKGTLVKWVQVFDDARTAEAVRQIVEPANEQNLGRMTQVLGQASGR